MAKGFLQSMYDWFDSIDFPPWLHEWLDKIWKKVVLPSLQNIGLECLMFLEKKIIAAGESDMSGKNKLNSVISAFRKEYGDMDIADSLLNWTIETLVQKLKVENFID